MSEKSDTTTITHIKIGLFFCQYKQKDMINYLEHKTDCCNNNQYISTVSVYNCNHIILNVIVLECH